jgi:hypothetical protein
MAARAQLEQMRRALPPGMVPGQVQHGPGQEDERQQQRASGPYL